MRIRPINERDTPQLFFLWDETAQAYTKENADVSAEYPGAKAFRRRCRSDVNLGYADLVFRSSTIELHAPKAGGGTDLLAEAEIVGDLWHNDQWVSDTFSFADAEVEKVDDRTFRAWVTRSTPEGNAIWGVQARYAKDDTKLLFYIKVRGGLVRLRWRVRAYEFFQDENHPHKRFPIKLKAHDYQGAVDHVSVQGIGYVDHQWTFEPDGFQCPNSALNVQDGLLVDPYMYPDSSSNGFWFFMDGLDSFIYSNVADYDDFILLYEKNDGTDRVFYAGPCLDTGSAYYLGYDLNKYTDLVCDESYIQQFRTIGRLETGGQIPLSAVDWILCHFTVFKDRIFGYYELQTNTQMTLDNIEDNGIFCAEAYSLEGENTLYENSGSESDAPDDTEQNSADYLLGVANQINTQIITLLADIAYGAAAHRQLAGTDNYYEMWFGPNNGTLGETSVTHIHKFAFAVIFDSVQREYGSQLYTESDRLAMAIQYKDVSGSVDPSVSGGASEITDLFYPPNLNSSNFAADGMYHMEVDQTEFDGRATFQQTEHRPVVCLHNWPFLSGSTPDNHLITHHELNDNAASATIAAETGSAGTWKDESNNSRNTNNDDTTERIRGATALDTQEAYFVEMSLTGHGNDFFKKGSAIIKAKPQFAYDTANDQVLFHVYVDANNYLELRYDASYDGFEFEVCWGSTSQTAQSNTWDANRTHLNHWYTFVVGWDSDRDFIYFRFSDWDIDFKVNTGTPSASAPSYVSYGAQRTAAATIAAGDYILEEIKTFDAMLLNYGAYFIGNGAGLLADISNPHASLIFFWDCQAEGSAAAKGTTGLDTDKTITLANDAAIVTTDPILGTSHLDTAGGSSNIAYVSNSSNDIINPAKGTVGIWVNPQTLAEEDLWGFSNDANNSQQIRIDASNNWAVTFVHGGTNTGASASVGPTAGHWYFVELVWSEEDSFWYLFVDGRRVLSQEGSIGTYSGTPSSVYFGSGPATGALDCFVGAVYHANEAFAPKIWSNFGKPLWLPLVTDGS